MFGVIMPLCNRIFCCIFGWYFYIEIRLKYEKNILFLFLSPLFCCVPLWKTVRQHGKKLQNATSIFFYRIDLNMYFKSKQFQNPTIFNIGTFNNYVDRILQYFDRLKMKQWVAGLEIEHSILFIFISLKL